MEADSKSQSSNEKLGFDGKNESTIAGNDVETGKSQLQRKLHSRHLQFIAIGGTIGTGLFLGSGTALSTSGPVGCLIAYVFVGVILFSVMSSLGEMATFMPVPGSFTVYATRFVDPSLGFAMSWIYWFSWAITFALELTAAGILIQYWDSSLNIGIFIAIFWVIFTAINFLPVRWFGELEMWLSSIKVITIIGFVIFAICVNAGVGAQGYLGFRYWKDPGPFVEYLEEGATGKFVGFWAVLITAGLSYQGSELVGVGAGETQNPRETVPSAIRWTFWSIFCMFVAVIFFIGLLVPSDNQDLLNASDNASASPLVIAAKLAGIPVLPDIINAVLLTAVLSAANSNVYSGSRILVALAGEKQAPSFIAKTNKHGTPYVAVSVTAACGLLAFLNLSSSGGVVFTWLLNITAIAGFITWACINICHLRFMSALRYHGIQRHTLPYIAPFQPWLAIFGLFFIVLIILTSGFTVFINWETSGFFAAYISLIIFAVLFVGHKAVTRSRPHKLCDIDLTAGRVD